jgi:putative ATP-grasp target RiPP
MSRTGANVSTRWPSVEGLGKFLTMGATRSYAQDRFTADPVATVSAQFSLGSPAAGTRRCDEASSAVRPWGLRDLVAAAAGTPLPGMSYDHGRQMAVLDDGSGRAFIDITAGPPTASTTSSVDGEDPPSSEDWKNDFASDDPACPF